jgi:hypothetical protein
MPWIMLARGYCCTDCGHLFLAGRVRVILGSEVLQLEVARTRHLISPDDGDEGAESMVGVKRCGHLMKKTPTAGHWVHRWFVLRADACLYYYKTLSKVYILRNYLN